MSGIDSSEEYGGWVKAKCTFHHMPDNRGTENREQYRGDGKKKVNVEESYSKMEFRFEIIREEEGTAQTQERKSLNKQKGVAQEWRKKDKQDNGHMKTNPTDLRKEKVQNVIIEEGQCSGLRQDNKERNGEPSLTTTQEANKKKGENFKKQEDNNGYVRFNEVGPREGPKELKKAKGRKRLQATRPKLASPLTGKKQVARIHNVVIGSILDQVQNLVREKGTQMSHMRDKLTS